MNTYFLGMLVKDKKRKKNKASIIIGKETWSYPWKFGIELGDMIMIEGSIPCIVDEKRWVPFYVPDSLKVTDHRFNPNYWCDHIHFSFSEEIVTRIKNAFLINPDVVKIKIGKNRYHIAYNENILNRPWDEFAFYTMTHHNYVVIDYLCMNMDYPD
jgi:hypothetical protein